MNGKIQDLLLIFKNGSLFHLEDCYVNESILYSENARKMPATSISFVLKVHVFHLLHVMIYPKNRLYQLCSDLMEIGYQNYVEIWKYIKCNNLSRAEEVELMEYNHHIGPYLDTSMHVFINDALVYERAIPLKFQFLELKLEDIIMDEKMMPIDDMSNFPKSERGRVRKSEERKNLENNLMYEEEIKSKSDSESISSDLDI